MRELTSGAVLCHARRLSAVGLALACIATAAPARADVGAIALEGDCRQQKLAGDALSGVVTRCLQPDGVEHWSIDRDEDNYTPRIWRFLEEKLNGLESTSFQTYLTNRPDRLPFRRSVALLLGIGDYEKLTNGEFGNLEYVGNDIELMRRTLIKTGLFDDIFIARNAIVNRQLIQSYFKRFAVLGPKDRLLFYFTGHGTEAANGDGALVLPGAQRTGFQTDTILKISDLRDWGDQLNAGHVLYLLDSCSSGLGRRSKGSGVYTQDSLDVINALSSRGSRVFITAGTAGQETFETLFPLPDGTKKGLGIFTWAFVNSWLDSIGQKESIGFVTVNDIYASMLRRISAQTIDLEKKYQIQPDLWRHNEGKYDGTFVLLDPEATFDGARLDRVMFGVRTRGGADYELSHGEQAQLLLLDGIAEMEKMRQQRALTLLSTALRRSPENAAVRAALAPLLGNIVRPKATAPFGDRQLRMSPDRSRLLAAVRVETYDVSIVQYAIDSDLVQVGNRVDDITNLKDCGYAADGKTFFVLDYDYEDRLRVFSADTGQPLFTYAAPKDGEVLSILPDLAQAWVSVPNAGANRWGRDTVRVDLESGAQLDTPAEDHPDLDRGYISYDSTNAASSRAEGNVVIGVDRRTLKVLFQLRLSDDFRGAQVSASLSDVGRLLVWGENGEAEVWNVKTARRLSAFRLSASPGDRGAAISSDGRIVAAAEHSGRIAFFDADRGTVIARRKGHDDEITDIAFSPDSRYVASAGADGAVMLWNARNGEVRAIYRSHRPGKVDYSDERQLFANYVSFVDNNTILSGGSDRELHLTPVFGTGSSDEFDAVAAITASPHARKWREDSRGGFSDNLGDNSLQLSPNGAFAAQRVGDFIVIWNIAAHRVVHISDGVRYVDALARFSPDNRYAVYARKPFGSAAEMVVIDLANGVVRQTISQPAGFCNYYMPSSSSKIIAAFKDNLDKPGDLRTFDLTSSTWSAPVPADSPCRGRVEDGKLLLDANQYDQSRQGSIDIYDEVLKAQRKTVLDGYIMEFDVRGDWLLLRGDHELSLRNLESEQPSARLDVGTSARFVNFSPRGILLAIDDSGDVVFLDGASGQELAKLTSDQSRYVRGVFMPSNDIELAALARENGTVEVWDYVLRRKLYDFFASAGVLQDLTYDAGSEKLFVQTTDGVVRTWRIPSLKLSAEEVDALSDCYSPWHLGVDLLNRHSPVCTQLADQALAKLHQD